MFNWNTFPWTDFQNLNLDWVMKKIKSHGEDIATLDTKVDTAMASIYQYIQDNLPSIIQQIASVVIDVTQAGAVGDGVTDDSDAINNALSMGDILYFPAGTYCFKNIEVNKPVIFWGAGESFWQPIHRHANTNQSYTMVTCYDSVVFEGIGFKANADVVTQSGTRYLTQAAVVAETVKSVVFNNCSFADFYETYRLQMSSVAFEDRHGMATKIHNCDLVIFQNCTFGDFGGQELLWIAHDIASYGDGHTIFNSCMFVDRNSGDTGSYLNIYGGSGYFTNNTAQNANNIYTGGANGGTLFNIMCANSVVADNIFTDCNCGNYVDISEGYYNKVDNAIVSNNIMRGSALRGIRSMANHLTVIGNVIEAEEALETYQISTIPATGVPGHTDINTLYDFNDIIIKDNTFIACNNPFGDSAVAASQTLFLGKTPDGATPVTQRVQISGNTFYRNSDAVTLHYIYLFGTVNHAWITDNVFKNAGYISPGVTSIRAVIGGTEDTTQLLVANNIMDMSDNPDSLVTYMLGGASGYRDTVTYAYNNIALGSNVKVDYNWTQITASGNIGFTA